jgi:nucleoid DNA-binding protein
MEAFARHEQLAGRGGSVRNTRVSREFCPLGVFATAAFSVLIVTHPDGGRMFCVQNRYKEGLFIKAKHMVKAAGKPPTKTEVYGKIADSTGLSKKDVAAVFDSLADMIRKALGKSGPKAFTIHGLCKITVQHKPATKERKGTNPFTGEETIFKAKPARNVVKVRPLKNLKDMV